MGRLRGQRNRDQDRYWQIQRGAEQSGMVGALDVPICCFCGHLVANIDAGFTGFGDAYCRTCGVERGLINDRLIRGDGGNLTVLSSIEALEYSEGVTGRGGRQRGSLVGAQVFRQPSGRSESFARTRTLERFAREVEREQEHEREKQQRLGLRLERRAEHEREKQQRRLEHALQRELERERLRGLSDFQREQARYARLLERERRGREREERRLGALLLLESERSKHRRDRVFLSNLQWLITAQVRGALRLNDWIQGAFATSMRVGTGRPRGRQFVPGRKVLQTDFGQVAQSRRQLIREKDRKLTNAQAMELRRRYQAGGVSQARLGRDYSVTQAHVALILSGAVYRSAGGPFYWPKRGFFNA